MADKITVKDSTICKTGHYTGKIVRAESRKQLSKDQKSTYDLKDYFFQVNVSETEKPEIKLSFFKNDKESSDIIKFIKSLGFTVAVKSELDLDCPVGVEVEFDVINEQKNGAEYSNIASKTVKRKQ